MLEMSSNSTAERFDGHGHWHLLGIALTGWKVVGYLGVLLFAGRWVVQVLATHAYGRPVVPRTFWSMSVSGSLLLLAYFIWGKNDSVGMLSNLFPMLVALNNLAPKSNRRGCSRHPSYSANSRRISFKELLLLIGIDDFGVREQKSIG